MPDDDLSFLSLAEAARRIRSRELSPVELTRHCLDRIAAIDVTLNSFVTVTADLAIEQARAAEAAVTAGRDVGPLHGVPIALKDLYGTKGVRTTAHSKVLLDNVPAEDAATTALLARAGTVLLGKLAMHEFAFGTPGFDTPFPPARNPWNPEHVTGGSSSGSGAALAAGLCYGSLGSDTGGSIRIPAAHCGIVGLKPTYGRVSRYGVFPLSETLDHIGPMTRRVEDAAAMLGAIAGRDENDPSSSSEPVPNYLAGIGKGLKNVTLGFDEKYCSADVDPAIVATLKKAVSVLRKAGATVKAVKMPSTEGIVAGWVAICAVEAALGHTATYPSRKEGYGPVFSGFLDSGRTLSGLEYGRAAIARRNLRGALQRLFTDIDIMVVPITPWLNPSVAEFNALCESPDGLNKLIHFTCPYDTTGQPTITLPAGLDANGSPIGFQIVGRHFEEALLCRAGMAWQDAARGKGAIPPLAV